MHSNCSWKNITLRFIESKGISFGASSTFMSLVLMVRHTSFSKYCLSVKNLLLLYYTVLSWLLIAFQVFSIIYLNKKFGLRITLTLISWKYFEGILCSQKINLSETIVDHCCIAREEIQITFHLVFLLWFSWFFFFNNLNWSHCFLFIPIIWLFFCCFC